jgi:hypothetical protein
MFLAGGFKFLSIYKEQFQQWLPIYLRFSSEIEANVGYLFHYVYLANTINRVHKFFRVLTKKLRRDNEIENQDN